MRLTEIEIDTAVGPYVATVDEAGVLRAARFGAPGSRAASPRAATPHATPPHATPPHATPPHAATVHAALRERLAAYFAGAVDALDDLRVEPDGSPFQRRVWDALRCTRAGETLSYGRLAALLELHDVHAARAVGAANAANPAAVVIPCHRVIAADGRPLGYAWGVERKTWLLRHEAEHAAAAGVQGRLL